MTNKAVIEMVRVYLKPIADEHGLDIYDIEFVKEGPNWYFRIYIEKSQTEKSSADNPNSAGISIDDCELISRAAEKYLDEKDPIPQAYMLEVSSPGLDRPLKKDADFKRYIGSAVNIKLYKAEAGRKTWEGILTGFSSDILTIDVAGTEQELKRENVASCRLTVVI